MKSKSEMVIDRISSICGCVVVAFVAYRVLSGDSFKTLFWSAVLVLAIVGVARYLLEIALIHYGVINGDDLEDDDVVL